MKNSLLKALVAIVTVVSLYGCGGGGGGGGGGGASSSSPATTNIGGVAATGAAISGGTVDANCASGTVPSTTTDATGNYTLTFTGATLPCILRVSVPNTNQYLYSIVETGATTANLTPLSHFLSNLLFGADSATVFSNFSSTYAQQITSANIASAQQKVVSALSALGIDVSGVDVLKTSFTPTSGSTSGDAFDKKLDQLATTLVLANKSISDLSTAINASPSTSVSSITATAAGPSAVAFSECPYVRGGNYWTFTYNGSNFNEWTIDITAMTATAYGTSNTYPVAKLTNAGSVVPCAFTITLPTSVITAYFSNSGVFAWKQAMNAGGYYFGLGVPVQTTSSLSSSNYAGTYPLLGYLAYQVGNQNYQAALPMEMAIDSSGNVKTATCALTNGVPVCSPLSSSTSTALTCGNNSQGIVTCSTSDGSTTAKVFAITTQQQPTVFMLMSGTISNVPYTSLIVGTKSNTLKLPAVGAVQSTSSAWYFTRNAQSNPNTSWTFASGDTTSGSTTTVTSVSTLNSSFTMSNGLVWYLNLPITGELWTPTVTNSTFTTGSNQMLSMTSNGGWEMRVTGTPSVTSFNNFNGVEFFIKKPM